ncbi:MAG TPA: hypothetical protein VK769_01245 [Verrucomicrobiae bacterium]|jgi:hypothetical protein|nr:hypothetical protein [Verrucomicrobiae bacterium]
MKQFRSILPILILLGASSAGNAVEPPLPPLATVLSNAVQTARLESVNDHNFNQHYFYTRTKVTEYHNAAGDLKKHDEKQTINDPTRAAARKLAQVAEINQPKTGSPSDTQTNVRGKAADEKDFTFNDDFLKRFTCTLAGREMINGRSALVIDFKPSGDNLPVNNIKDKFINHAAGRAWIDESDYALVKGQAHLTQQVNIFGGLAGAVWKFTYSFDRERTADGLWFPRDVDWHLEGREVVIDRIVDYHEKTTDVRKAP